MSRINIIWWIYFLGAISMIYYSWMVASDGGIRTGKKVVFKSNIQKVILAFPTWISQIDCSYIIVNLINEVWAIFFVVGWFVLSKTQKQFFLERFYLVGVIILFVEVIWSIIVNAFSEKKKVYVRETSDFEEMKGSIKLLGGNEYTYNYVLTYLKRGISNKCVFFLPESYYIVQDVNGNLRKRTEQDEFVITDNIGAYEELSDSLVRAGYTTIRCERSVEELHKHYNGEKRLIDLKKVVKEILQKEKLFEKVFLLSHGENNRWLPSIADEIDASGIISLCGAGMGDYDKAIRCCMWKGMSRRKAEKKIKKVIQKNMADTSQFDFKLCTKFAQDEFVKMLSEKKVPTLIGYVKEDPFYDEKIAEEIGKSDLEGVKIIKFDDTDFTLRKCMTNKKRSVTEIGREINQEQPLEPINPIVEKEIIQWLSNF